MTSFALTEDQQTLVDLARQVALDKFSDKAMTWLTTGESPVENLDILRKAGLFGVSVPEEFGGAGLTAVDALLTVEAVASVCPATATLANIYDLGPASVLHHHGSDDQKQRYLKRMMSGELLPAISVTEPEAGTATTSLRTAARIEGDECVINGGKIFCSFANVAGIFMVYVRFGPRTEDIGAVIVERDAPGLTIGPTQHHMFNTPWCELSFEDCRVPAANVMPLERGFKDLIATYNMERLGAAAKVLGIAECARAHAQRYVLDRQQFGHPLWDFQGLRWKFAEMELKIQGARLLTYAAAMNADNDQPDRLASSLAKVAATEAAAFVVDEAMQVCGATGMDMSTGMPQLFAAARGYRIAGGASEVHRDMIARDQLTASWLVKTK